MDYGRNRQQGVGKVCGYRRVDPLPLILLSELSPLCEVNTNRTLTINLKSLLYQVKMSQEVLVMVPAQPASIAGKELATSHMDTYFVPTPSDQNETKRKEK